MERMAELEDENAALKEAAQRRSAVLQQSRSFITSYLEVCHRMIKITLLLTSGCMGCQYFSFNTLMVCIMHIWPLSVVLPDCSHSAGL